MPRGKEKPTGSSSRPRSRARAATLFAALIATGAWSGGLPDPTPDLDWPLLEPLSTALASGRVRTEELRGREVYSFDETPIGTLVGTTGTALVALDARLGLNRRCLAMPLQRLRLDAEHRLLLDMTPQEFRTALAAQLACGS